MSRTRLLLPRASLALGSFRLTGDALHHARVLRLQIGEEISLCDGEGIEIVGTITTNTPKEICISLTETLPAEAPMPLAITLVQGIPRGERLDFILQKSTELGVSRIVLAATERSVSRPEGSLARWEKIIVEAARQCGRRYLPRLEAVFPWKAALDKTRQESDLCLFCDEEEQAISLRTVLPQSAQKISIAVGPEGGFSYAERQIAKAAGFGAITLGPRILRTETASLALLSILQHRYGDLG